MSRKLTLDINFIDTPRDGDKFGYQITNNGVPLTFNGFNGWDKTFKETIDYTNANGNLMVFNTDLTPTISGNTAIGNGFNGPVNVIKRQSTGKYICVGGFNAYQGITLPSRKICRLNADFSLDTSFTPPDFPVDLPTLEIDSNDKIYLGSSNTTSGKGRLVRLNANGTLDGGYMPGIGFDRPVMAIKLQPDGKLLVAGVFTTFNSSPAKGIIRLGITGVKDVSFNGVNQGFVLNNSYPRTIDLLSTGEIVVGGDFYMYNNTTCGNIIILTTTGAVSKVPTDLDNSPGGTYSENVLKVLVDSTDKIYVTGKFEQYGGGVPCNKLIRLYKNSFNNWVPDLTFNVISQGLDNGNSTFTTGGFDMLLNNDGNLVVAGNFGTVQGTTAQNIAVLSPTGTLSPNSENTNGVFSSTGGIGAPIVKTILNLGDRFIVGGIFNSYSNIGIPAISSQFVIPIAEELNVNFGQGFYNGTVDNYTPSSISIRNNKIVATGNFISYDSNGANKVVRINPDGSYDNTFDSSVGVTSSLLSNALVYTAIDKDDKVYIVGDIVSYDGNATTNLARINADGTFDATFDTGSGFNNAAVSFVLPDDVNGGALFLGSFTQYSGNTVGRIAKILDDGALDATFNVGTGFNGPTLSAVDTGDGYVISGAFTQYSGVSQNYLVKLKYDGSKDNTFIANASTSINGLIKQSDGKIVCLFNGTYNGVAITGNMFRINANGSYDPTFDSSTYVPGGTGAPRNLIEVDSQDRIYVYSFNDLTVIRFTKDGELDTTFNVTELAGINSSTNYLKSMKMYFNNLVVVGNMEVNSIPQGIAMLGEDGSVVTTNVDNYQTIINTYQNLLTYNSGYDIQYSLFPTKVEMKYVFDNDEIVVNDVFDTPDYVEITYINESLTINEIIDEVVVRSPLLIKSAVGTYDSVNYKVRIFDGNLFTSLTYPVLYDITKQKLFDGQANVYININNYVREKLEADIVTILNNNYYNGTSIPINMSKWVRVDETLLLTGSTVDTNINYLLATDGYLFNDEDQYIPNVLLSGLKRYCRYNQPQNIYYQTNFLVNILYLDSLGTEVKISSDKNLELLNWQYINSLAVNTAVDWVQYTFNYSNSAPITVRYEMYSDCQFEPYTLVFKNKWGMLESIPMSRKSITTLNTQSKDYNRSILDYNGNYDINRHTNKQYNVNGYDSWTLNSNWLPEYMNLSLEELMLSEEVWLLDSNNEIIPVIKEDQNLTFKTELNDRMIQYTIKVKMSHSKIKNIL